jgi:hypothetical protein
VWWLLRELRLIEYEWVDPVLNVRESTPLVELHAILGPSIIHDLDKTVDGVRVIVLALRLEKDLHTEQRAEQSIEIFDLNVVLVRRDTHFKQRGERVEHRFLVNVFLLAILHKSLEGIGDGRVDARLFSLLLVVRVLIHHELKDSDALE